MRFSRSLFVAGLVFILIFTHGAIAAEPTTAPAFDEALKALKSFKIIKGLKGDVFAAEPQLANPVALWPDERGRLWVVETYRFEANGPEPVFGVHDIRHMYDRLDDDLACRTVEDRLAFLNKYYHNDLSAHAKYPDAIRLLEDTDGDHRADRSTTFADDFKDPLDGIAAGILVRGEDVYFTNIPHLWLLRDTDHDGKADYRQSLSYGYGVRYNFLGHDLHGLRFGPDGKLYFSIGDRGLHVKTREGNILDEPDVGAVMRCDPDGANLEIFARGLRNPQELTFDEHGNLFSGDNNNDRGDPAKWVYLVEGGDSGWRVGYQHQETPTAGGPWMNEKLYATEAPDNAAYLVPPIGHIAAGPSGCTYYPGTGLSDRFNKHFLLTDFRAGPSSVIHNFSLKPKGASFEMEVDDPFLVGCLATDVDFGIDGSVFVCDWISGFQMNGKGRVYRFFDPDQQNAPLVLETKKLLFEGMKQRSLSELQTLLAHADMRVRTNAQWELAARKLEAMPALTSVASKNANPIARLHAIWGIGQIARQSSGAARPLLPLLSDRDAEVRAQTAKVLGDLHDQTAYPPLLEMLGDPEPRVRFFAAISVGKVAKPDALVPVLGMLSRAGNDAYLRHAGVMALAGINDVPGMLSAAQYASQPARMGIALALRRLKRPEIAQFLRDPNPAIVLEAARAINDVPIEAAQPGLAALISRHDYTDTVMVRVLNANYRSGNAYPIAALAADESATPLMREEALHLLGLWEKPSGRDRVVGNWRPLAARDGAIAAGAARNAISSILRNAPTNVRLAAIELAKKVGVEDSRLLFEIVISPSTPREVRAAALEAMSANRDPYLRNAVEDAFAEPKGALHVAAIKLLGQFPDAVARLQIILAGKSVADQQAVFTTLPTIPAQVSDEILSSWLDKLVAKNVPTELQLDLLNAAEKSKAPEIKKKIEQYDASRSPGDPLSKFRECLAGGDVEAGRKVFFEKPEVSCVKCHKADAKGGIVGPDLSGIGAKKDREYLLASLLYPNKEIAAGFETVSLKLKDNTFRSGIVKSQTETEMVLDNPDKGMLHVAKDQIVSRSPGVSAMPEDIAKPLSKTELRNLVEFLAAQNKP